MEVSRSILTPLYPEGVLAGCAFLPRGYKAAGRFDPVCVVTDSPEQIIIIIMFF
jgi:hypothetical protein